MCSFFAEILIFCFCIPCNVCGGLFHNLKVLFCCNRDARELYNKIDSVIVSLEDIWTHSRTVISLHGSHTNSIQKERAIVDAFIKIQFALLEIEKFVLKYFTAGGEPHKKLKELVDSKGDHRREEDAPVSGAPSHSSGNTFRSPNNESHWTTLDYGATNKSQARHGNPNETVIYFDEEGSVTKRDSDPVQGELLAVRSELELSKRRCGELESAALALHCENRALQSENGDLRVRVEGCERELRNLAANAAPTAPSVVEQAEKPAEISDTAEDVTGDESSDERYIRESLQKIEDVREYVGGIGREIDSFSGTESDRSFLHLKEMLIRSVIKLDDVESEGRQIIRDRRKEVILRIHYLSDELQSKAHSS